MFTSSLMIELPISKSLDICISIKEFTNFKALITLLIKILKVISADRLNE